MSLSHHSACGTLEAIITDNLIKIASYRTFSLLIMISIDIKNVLRTDQALEDMQSSKEKDAICRRTDALQRRMLKIRPDREEDLQATIQEINCEARSILQTIDALKPSSELRTM